MVEILPVPLAVPVVTSNLNLPVNIMIGVTASAEAVVMPLAVGGSEGIEALCRLCCHSESGWQSTPTQSQAETI